MLWLWHFLYSVGPHPVSSLCIYTFAMSRAFMAGVASQAGDADSSRAPCLISALQGSVNVHRGALLLVPQWQCISSFVFYILIFSLASISQFLRIRQKNKYVCLLSLAEKIRVGRNFFFFLIWFFITELMLDAFLHLKRDILTRFFHTGNNDL